MVSCSLYFFLLASMCSIILPKYILGCITTIHTSRWFSLFFFISGCIATASGAFLAKNCALSGWLPLIEIATALMAYCFGRRFSKSDKKITTMGFTAS
ncbi:hypothetical protein P153DRAFT_220285 [Dothidotthia symphoricarpi CBS 119687]|uniref:Uncharacterized protein n=1 Tax=Dothidotthia symphoricarpi CBS 119687 TaxID=1392245 RepID=A0A6A6AEZ1_9PLEO|nr:uncharacterized protein P153DRAFT_220285 [Dothidotthia symphoricarpi CBS 119687]KAF2130532.1 hypothetical protein P153DRAFT_220285 [Dothidotthia symphoricarpi CBS 119687]